MNAYLAFAERGKNFQKFLSKLRGMFAFAVLDLRDKKQPLLFLVRDRLGLKPLNFYYQKGEGLAFASLIRSLLPYLPKDQRDFDFQSVEAFLTHRYIPSPKTIFEKIQRLPHSHYLRYDISAVDLQIFKYWENPLISKKFSENLVENQTQTNFDYVKNELYKAVKIRTISDRPLGVFLSSGIDSSAIATILSEQNFQQFPTFTASHTQKSRFMHYGSRLGIAFADVGSYFFGKIGNFAYAKNFYKTSKIFVERAYFFSKSKFTKASNRFV